MSASELLARRAVVTGSRGAVSTGSRTAAAIGAAALLDGGNAFDAAVAAALAETVALPSKCGLAGDVVALYVPAGADTPISVVAIGGASDGLWQAAQAAGWKIAATGPLAVGVPGAPAGYAQLAGRGRMPLRRLAAPAIDLARRGIWWSPMNALLEQESRALLRRYQPGGCVYSPADGAHRVGDLVKLPGLAGVLEEFVVRGAGLFDGPLGDAVVARVRDAGGVLTAADLRSVRVDEEPAHSVRTSAGQVWATNTPTYGPALTHSLEGRIPAQVGPQEVHDSLTALAAGRLGDPSRQEGTSTVAAVDSDGNVVVVVHSLSFPQYGSGLVVGGHDLVLSNRAGRGFTFEPHHANSPVPGRRPLTTLHAWGVRAPQGWLLGATPGGQHQVSWNVQVLAQVIGDPSETTMAAALTNGRWQLDADGVEQREGRELAEFGARSSHTMVLTAGQRCAAAADPRWDGAAVAV